MPMQTICVITEKEWLNEQTVSMTLAAGALARDSRIGQFIDVKCGEGQLLRRPISICEIVGDRLRIVFAVKGEGTAWLAQRKGGEHVDVLGPLGHGFSLPVTGKVLVAGGGIGVPPLLACARAAGGRACAVLGFRSEKDAILIDEFRSCCRSVALCSDDGTMGVHGLADALVRDELEKDKTFTTVMACGPKPMLRAVASVAAAAGVPCQVSMEERMGCGIGACLACACRIRKPEGEHYLHVCKDGPVFDASEVCWDD